MIFPSSGGAKGFVSGKVSVTTGETKEIRLGTGILFLYTFGTAVCNVYGIDYWTTDIKTIFNSHNSLGVSISKNSNTGIVSIVGERDRNIGYVFIGEHLP